MAWCGPFPEPLLVPVSAYQGCLQWSRAKQHQKSHSLDADDSQVLASKSEGGECAATGPMGGVLRLGIVGEV